MTEPALAQNVKGKGRHYTHPVTGQLLPSVTNVIGILDKPAIPRWAAKLVAEQAWALRGSLDQLDEAEAIDLLKGAPWRNSTRAANRGTAVHALLERLTLGETTEALTGEAADYQKGVDRFLEEHEVVPFGTEVTVFGDGYAGTADMIGTVDGVPAVLDYKTGKSGPYPEVALQLEALRNATHCISWEDGSVIDMPTTEVGVAVLIKPTGSYVIKKVDDPDGSLAAFRSLLAAWHWVKQDGGPLGAWEEVPAR